MKHTLLYFSLVVFLTMVAAFQANAQVTFPEPRFNLTDDIFITPTAEFDAVYDTDDETLDVTGLEFSTSLRTPYIDGFANWHYTYFDNENDWEGENEEAFLKLHSLPGLPGDLAVRGGRFFNRFGHRNALHLHAWDWRDQTLAHERFLGDEGIATEGGELSFRLPTGPNFITTTSLAFGDARAHDHGHGDEDEHGHDDEDDHHDDDDDHHDDDDDHHDDDDDHHDDDDEHGHEDEQGHSEFEELGYSDTLGTARIHTRYSVNDFNQWGGGISYAFGEIESGEDLNTIGLHLNYTWRENGLEPGGNAIRWTTELLRRDIDLDEVGSQDELGGYTQASYRFSPFAEVGLRLGYTEGIDAIDMPSAFRVSPRIAIFPLEARNLRLHAQFNHTDIDGEEDEQTVLLGLSLGIGAPEVR